jgi:antitoxin ParD1/3/4
LAARPEADMASAEPCQILPKRHNYAGMSTMNISLPDSLKSFVDEQVLRRGYATSSEYVRELIRLDQDRQCLRDLLLDGATAPAKAAADDDFFDRLRDRARQAKGK